MQGSEVCSQLRDEEKGDGCDDVTATGQIRAQSRMQLDFNCAPCACGVHHLVCQQAALRNRYTLTRCTGDGDDI
jgi:hypothetical protein